MAESFGVSLFQNTVKTSGGFLYGNKYKVMIGNNTDMNIILFACKIDIPSIDYAQTDIDIGGNIISTPMKYSKGDIIITFYNTGDELTKFRDYCDKNIFTHNNHSFGYYDDIVMDISVYEYNIKGEPRILHQFQKCMLKSISGLNYSYAESTEVQTFSISFSCKSSFVSKKS